MTVKVFFNNSCNICRFEINHYKKNSNNSIDWIDISNNEDAMILTSKTKAELLRRLHVIDNGKVIGGAKHSLLYGLKYLSTKYYINFSALSLYFFYFIIPMK